MVEASEIAEKIINGEFSSGAECTFFKLDEKWGLKLYDSEEVRDIAHENHAYFLKYGLAPDLKRKINLPSFIEKRYGYICEVVEVLIDPVYVYSFEHFHWNSAYDDFEDADSWNEHCDDLINSIMEKYSDEYEELMNKLAQNDLMYSDDHLGNFGLKNGKMIIIDFDN